MFRQLNFQKTSWMQSIIHFKINLFHSFTSLQKHRFKNSKPIQKLPKLLFEQQKAMDIFKRIGTQKKKFKLQFFIGRLKFSSFFQGKVYIVVKRGNHKVKSEQKLEMPEDCKLNFNKQILQLEVTLYFDEKQNKYQQKSGEMNIVMIDPKGNKVLLGIVPFDVGQYANLGQESIKEKKQIEQTPKKLEGLIEYNVFIKYIGEGSESSLDKVADFFFGKSKQPESDKKVSSKNEIVTTSKENIEDDSKKESGKDLSKTEYKKGTHVDFYQVEALEKKQKNYVTAGKNAREGSRDFVQDTEELAKNFYFDESSTSNKKGKQKSSSLEKNQAKRKKNDSEQNYVDRNSEQHQDKKFRKDKQNKSKHQPQSDKRILPPTNDQTFYTSNSNPSKDYLNLQKQLQKKSQETQSYKQKLLESEKQVKELEKLLTLLKGQNTTLSRELQQCKEQLRQKDEELQEHQAMANQQAPTYDNQLQKKLEFYQQELKRVQKQKNQMIVENSKLKEKYKQDFKKYEQLLSEKQEKSQDRQDSTKADLQKLKDECSQYRETIQKLKKQKSDKNSELSKQKTENRALNQQLAEVKTNLSKIKIKICNKLNQALAKNQDHISDMLMDLNKEE